MTRQILVDEIIRRFPDYIDTEAAKGIEGVVGWELVGPGDEADRFSLVVDNGVVRIRRGRGPEPTVALRLDVVSFLKIATGNGDPATMVLAGDLEIAGDPWFALELLRLVHIPTPDGPVHLDRSSRVDVRAVARLVREIPDRLLHQRLRGPVRTILLDGIVERMPAYLDAGRAAGVDALVAWQIGGRRGGGADEYRMLIRDGRCLVGRPPDEVPSGRPGELPGRPRSTLRTDSVMFLKLVTGNASPVRALLRRRLSLRGEVLFAARLPGLFAIPAD